jgi:hypothetical protein
MKSFYFIEMGWGEVEWIGLAQVRENERLGVIALGIT